MAYAQIDVGALRHPKVLQLSDAAFRLWVAGLCYCQEHLTDGVLAACALPVLGARTETALVDELVRAGLWQRLETEDPTGGGAGVRIHDYLAWNKSRAQVDRERQEARDRAERSRQQRKLAAERKASRQQKAAVRRTCGARAPHVTPARNAHGAEPLRNATLRDATLRNAEDQELSRLPAGGVPPEGGALSGGLGGAGRVLVRLAHDVLATSPETDADASDLLKTLASRAHLAYTSREIAAALEQAAVQRQKTGAA